MEAWLSASEIGINKHIYKWLYFTALYFSHSTFIADNLHLFHLEREANNTLSKGK